MALIFEFIHTLGHTPEHLAYLLAESDHPDTPWGVLAGDSLFVSSAGRPDLLGSGEAKKLTGKGQAGCWISVHEIERAGKRLQLLDVRAPDEWEGGHIPNASHIFLGELRERLGKLDRTKPTAVYCDSGYRASIATSILQQAGFDCVCNIPGSWQAWKEAGFPVEGDQKKEKK